MTLMDTISGKLVLASGSRNMKTKNKLERILLGEKRDLMIRSDGKWDNIKMTQSERINVS